MTNQEVYNAWASRTCIEIKDLGWKEAYITDITFIEENTIQAEITRWQYGGKVIWTTPQFVRLREKS